MQYQSVESEARSYMYDLMNEAKEHGFKAEDKWTLCLVTKSAQEQIRKDYYPTVVNEVAPDALLQLFHLVKSGLHQSLSKEELLIDTKSIIDGQLNYIIAFNPKRQR